MRLSRFFSCVALVGASALAAAPALAQVDWNNPSGDQTDFSWSNGHNENDFYGSPTNTGHTFTFNPSGFVANDQFAFPDVQILQLPNENSTSDTFTVDIAVKSGFRLFNVSVNQGGTFSAAEGTVDTVGQLTVVDLDQSTPTTSDMQTVPVFPTTDSTGNWTGTASLVGDWTNVRISMNTTVAATGAPLTTASLLSDPQLTQAPFVGFNQISLDSAQLILDIRSTTPAVPLPSALLLFPAGAAAAAYCSRRFRRA
jgi:hypothetical protein